MALEQYSNFGTATLTATLLATNTDTLVKVNGIGNFPSSTPFTLVVDTEVMLCTASSAGTCTVLRAQESTAAGTHTSGAVVYHALTAGVMDQIRKDVVQFGAFLSLPSTTGQKTGNTYKCTDTPYEFIYNGSAWVAYYRSVPVTMPNAATFDTVVNSSTAMTTSTTYGGVIFTSTASFANAISYLQSTNTATGTHTYALGVSVPYGTNAEVAGITTRDSGSSKLRYHFLYYDATANCLVAYVQTYVNGTTFNSTELDAIKTVRGSEFFLRLVDDGTNITFQVSNNNTAWTTAYTYTRTTYFTLNQVGFLLQPSSTRSTQQHLFHWLNV